MTTPFKALAIPPLPSLRAQRSLNAMAKSDTRR